jgi:hypothetical protein
VNLLGNDTTLTLGGGMISLRPTLRCGLRLESREGSFAKLIEDLQDGSLTAALFVLRGHHDHPFANVHVMDAGLEHVCASLIAFVLQCAGIDPDATAEGEADTASVSFSEHLTNLYRIGTGWLGWTPDTTLSATPAEITEAYKGRVELLKAVFGGDQETKTKPKSTPDQIREAFRLLGAQTVKGGRP